MTSDKRYTGKMCDRHPEAEGVRYKANSACVECVRSTRDAWGNLNREKLIKVVKKWRSKNKDKINAAARLRRANKRGADDQ